ncbi:MAG TPA: hypothetical protein VF469_29050 [Kofleriaceae bacterium]
MKRALFGVMVMLVLVAAEHARAEDVPSVAEVRQALAQQRYSEGYRLAERLVAARPADPDAALVAGEACGQMALFHEARDHLRVALQASPDDARLHGMLARVAAIEGDDDTARKEAGQALALDAGERSARMVMNDFELLDRFAQHASPEPEPGSASELVLRLVQMMSRRAPPSELAPFLDRTMFARVSPQILGGSDPAEEVIEGFYDTLETGSRRVAAWEVGPDVNGNGVVPVHVLFEVHWTPASVAATRRPSKLPPLLGASAIENRLKGIDPADRDAVLSRLMGVRQRGQATLQVHVVTIDGRRKVADVESQGITLRKWVRERLARLASLTAQDKSAATGRGVSDWMTYISLAIVLAFLLRRSVQRRCERQRSLDR